MTRARTASYGVVTPPPLDRWIDAVLMLCVSLVQGAATTLGMIFNRTHRDWHTETAHEDLPQAKSGNQPKETPLAAKASRTEACTLARVPCEGRGPVLREAQTSTSLATSALTHADQSPALILSLSKDAGDTVDVVARTTSA